MTIWLPIQVFSIGLITYFSIRVFHLSATSDVHNYNVALLKSGLFNISYFILANVKDTGFFLYNVIWGGEKGFDNALFLHGVTLPIDIIAQVSLSVWGSATLFQEESLGCRQEEKCAMYMTVVQ